MNEIPIYRDFIASKAGKQHSRGFSMKGNWADLFTHQRASLEFSCETGRSASFLDTGLGKSRVEAALASEAADETGRPSLILTPLAVASQMRRECEQTGVDAKVIREASDATGHKVYIANYERLNKLDISIFGGVVLDESSILKSFAGSTKTALVSGFADTPYRLAATATPAPNDYMELGSHSEFLGYLGSMEMLCRWFINDTSQASQKWRIKGHAQKDYWEWVASWSRSAAMPSDLGGDDAGFILPPLNYHVHKVQADVTVGADDGCLFRMPDNSATSVHKEKRLTMDERVAMASEIANATNDAVIVWCETNEESTALTKRINGAIEVRGSMTADQKEAALDRFSLGQERVIVTKPKVAGFGLNWQHANCVIFASISHSYEQHYQAIRRSWRFGQKKPVDCHVVISDTEYPMWTNVQRKSRDHMRMKATMAKSMSGAQKTSIRKGYTREDSVTLPKFMTGEA